MTYLASLGMLWGAAVLPVDPWVVTAVVVPGCWALLSSVGRRPLSGPFTFPLPPCYERRPFSCGEVYSVPTHSPSGLQGRIHRLLSRSSARAQAREASHQISDKRRPRNNQMPGVTSPFLNLKLRDSSEGSKVRLTTSTYTCDFLTLLHTRTCSGKTKVQSSGLGYLRGLRHRRVLLRSGGVSGGSFIVVLGCCSSGATRRCSRVRRNSRPSSNLTM